MKSLLPSALLAAALATSARAESHTFTLEKAAGGAVSCKHAAPEALNEGDIDVRLENGKFARLELYQPADSSTVFPRAKAGEDAWHIPRAKIGGEGTDFQLRDAADQSAAKARCEPMRITAKKATKAEAGGGTTSDTTAPLDPKLIEYWQTSGAAKLGEIAKKGHYPRKTHFLVHFANGEPAAPFPESIAEGEPLQVVLLADANKPPIASLTVHACEGVQPFRIREAAAAAGKPEAEEVAPPQPQPQLLTFGRTIVCGAGALSYTLRLDGVDHTQSVRIRPVYHLSATVAYGFDFVRQPSYSAPDGVVVRSADRAGLSLRLGFTWYPLGVDYEDFRWWSSFSNIVFAVDPTTPTEKFLVGTAITPTGGFGLLVGATFERITVLRGLKVGDPFTGPGDVPTAKAWRNSGIGLYVGLSLDDNVFAAIKSRLGAP